jgi:hypothetical protein
LSKRLLDFSLRGRTQIPRAAGGTNHLDNLAFACPGCNGQKFTATEAIDPVSGELVPLYHPRQDEWNVHFTFSEDFGEVIGLTSIGRATVSRLEMNRLGACNLRRLLHRERKFPPDQLRKILAQPEKSPP